MSRSKPIRVHLITGGYPPGSFAGHDMDYVRLRLLGMQPVAGLRDAGNSGVREAAADFRLVLGA